MGSGFCSDICLVNDLVLSTGVAGASTVISFASSNVSYGRAHR